MGASAAELRDAIARAGYTPVPIQAMASPGAASVVRAHQAFLLALQDIGCITDIDTLADLQAARQLLVQRA